MHERLQRLPPPVLRHAPEGGSPGDEAPPGSPGSGEDVCVACGGTGRIEDAPCPQCGGTGKVIRGIGGG